MKETLWNIPVKYTRRVIVTIRAKDKEEAEFDALDPNHWLHENEQDIQNIDLDDDTNTPQEKPWTQADKDDVRRKERAQEPTMQQEEQVHEHRQGRS